MTKSGPSATHCLRTQLSGKKNSSPCFDGRSQDCARQAAAAPWPDILPCARVSYPQDAHGVRQRMAGLLQGHAVPSTSTRYIVDASDDHSWPLLATSQGACPQDDCFWMICALILAGVLALGQEPCI